MNYICTRTGKPMGSGLLLSVSDFPQTAVLRSLISMRFGDARTIFDATYGRGGFWNGVQPTLSNDLYRPAGIRADFRALPLRDNAFDVVIFDPPFQPSTSSNKIARVAQQFTRTQQGATAHESVVNLKSLVQTGLQECWRVARMGLVVKVQDYIHDHRCIWMSLWCVEALGEPDEAVHVKAPVPKIIAGNWSRQLSVWRNHTTFYTFRKLSGTGR